MAIPILKQKDFLIASVQAAVSDAELINLRDDLADKVGHYRSRGVVLDVSALDVMDSFATRTLQVMVQMTRLRGAATVVVGIQPEVAFAMVEMGLTLEGVNSALDLEDGLELLERLTHGEASDER